MQLVRTCTALTLILIASIMLNAAIFPEMGTLSPQSREISTFCGAAFSLLIALVAYRRPSWIRERPLSLCFIALLALSMIALLVGLDQKSAELVCLGSPFGGIGLVWFSVLLGVALTRLSTTEAALAIPLSFVIAYGGRFVLGLSGAAVPLAVAALVYFLCIVGTYLLVRDDIAGTLALIRSHESPTVLDGTNPSSFLPLSSFVYLTIFLFNAAYGFEAAQSSRGLPLFVEVLSFLPVGLVLIFALSRGPRLISADALHSASALLVFAGLLLIPLRAAAGDAPQIGSIGSALLLRSGSDCFSVLTYFLIATIGARNPLGALSTSATAFAASWVGIGAGALGQMSLEALSARSSEAFMLATVAVTFVFVAYNFVALRQRSFDRTAAGLVAAGPLPRPAEPSAEDESRAAPNEGSPSPKEAPSEEAQLSRACAEVASRFKLTTRELDVLELLARGRTSPVIQKKLTVSHNTVKSHVRHIYTKLGVHSQQELIDLVEKEI